MADWIPDKEDIPGFDPPGDQGWAEVLSFGILGDDGASNALKGRVLGWVATWLVAGILVVRNKTISWVVIAWETLIGSLGDAGGALLDAIGVVGGVPLNLMDTLGANFDSLLTSLGPFSYVAYVIIIGMMVVFVDLALAFAVERLKGVIGVW